MQPVSGEDNSLAEVYNIADLFVVVELEELPAAEYTQVQTFELPVEAENNNLEEETNTSAFTLSDFIFIKYSKGNNCSLLRGN
jgi:hypothetical protein